MNGKKTLELDSMNHSNNFAVRYAMTNSSSGSKNSAATHRAAAAANSAIILYLCTNRYLPSCQIHTNTSYSSLNSFCQVLIADVLGCETTHGAYDNKKRTKTIRKKQEESALAIEPSTSDSLGVKATF